MLLLSLIFYALIVYKSQAFPGHLNAWGECKNPLGMSVIKECVVPGMIALTYDDGVSEYTSELLDILKSEKVRATFFVLGRQLAEDRSYANRMLKKMWNDGHDIGSHSYSHPSLPDLSNEEIKDQMERTAKLIEQAIGARPKLMRPPYGNLDWRVTNFLHTLGYLVVMWNVDSDDWRMEWSPAADIADHVSEKIPQRSSSPKKSYIILQHDTVKASVQAQRQIIRDLKAKGYKFGNLSECLGDAVVYKD